MQGRKDGLGSSCIIIETKKQVEVIDITSSVGKFVKDSSIENGICLVYTRHTTTGIVVNEAEPGLIQDLTRLMAALVPEGAGYLHDKTDRNAHAHLQGVLLGNSVIIPVEDERLVLGTWQKILFVELDGPRIRRVYVRPIKE